MPPPGPPSSHSSGESQPVNPYEATAIASPRSAAGPELPAPPPRNYRLTMAWADRRRFLSAVAPLRLYAIAGLVTGGLAILGLLQILFDPQLWFSYPDSIDYGVVVRSIFVIAKGALTFYICLLNWKFADCLAAAAGGKTGSMHDWSHLQLRLAQSVLALVALNGVSYGWDMFFHLYLIDLLRPQPL